MHFTEVLLAHIDLGFEEFHISDHFKYTFPYIRSMLFDCFNMGALFTNYVNHNINYGTDMAGHEKPVLWKFNG